MKRASLATPAFAKCDRGAVTADKPGRVASSPVRNWAREDDGSNDSGHVRSSATENHYVVNLLGLAYVRGPGVARNYKAAFRLFEKTLALDGYTPLGNAEQLVADIAESLANRLDLPD